jgi:hypothetical protein
LAIENLIDGVLITRAMDEETADHVGHLHQLALLVQQDTGDLWKRYLESRSFPRLHRVLLRVDDEYESLQDYLAEPDFVTRGIDELESRGRSALAWAAEYGFVQAARLLIQHGADPNQVRSSSHGGLPLLHLAIAGASRMDRDNSCLALIRLLVAAGADPNGRDHEGWTPFHVAASWENYAVVRELQLVSAVDYRGLTAAGESAIELSCDAHSFDHCLRVNSS